MSIISIIVPVYKVEKYIGQCVESILSQTYTDFELILVDDGSPDRSGAICDAYAERDPRVRVIHKENGGVSSARNVGLDVAKGEYVTFVDSDDWLSPSFLADAAEACWTQGLGLFMSGFIRVWQDGRTESSCTPREIGSAKAFLREEDYTQLLEANYIASPWAKLFCRDLIGDTRFPSDMRFGEDLTFVFALLEKQPRCLAVSTAYYCYRATENSLTSLYDEAKLRDVLQTYRVLLRFAERHGFASDFLDFVKRRWLEDLGVLQSMILNSALPPRKQYALLTVLTKDRQLHRMVRQCEDRYMRRYGSRPILLLCYRYYQKIKRKE